MSLPRLLTILIGLSLILGLMLWLVGGLRQLYLQAAFVSPFLSGLLLLVIIALLGVMVWAFLYYALLFGRPKPSQRQRLKAPRDKAQAAEVSLEMVRRQALQIQDEVARQALLARSREIAASLGRREIHVVVFGTGSAGKTSIVNALLGRMAGAIGAPMGTTDAGQTYQLQLTGLDRQILITDTPGILEAGVAGTEREKLARQLAAEADFLLFVVDNDLRQSEYEPLSLLAEVGKRSLLVFNKTDLYTEGDRETILARLRYRLRTTISADDVVAVAADPQAAMLPGGGQVKPDPEIMPLIRRMAEILRSEGENLVADNLLLQSQRLGEEARQLIDAQRRRQADQVVERFQWIGAGVVAVTPLPVVDLLGTAAVNAQMVVEIGRVYGCEMNLDRGRELALSLAKTLASLGIVKGALQLVTAALQTNIATFLLGRAIQGVSAAYLTRIAGKSFIEYFRQDQDWGDGGMAEVVQRQFQLNRRDEFLRVFLQEAIARVVQPLTQQSRTAENVDAEDAPEDAASDSTGKTAQYGWDEQGAIALENDDWSAPAQSPKDWS